jgi:uncharacterized protein YbaR (Trm112 family)
MAIDRELLEVLVCPACKGPLHGQPPGTSPEALDCVACRLRFPVLDDIPVMLIDQASRLMVH